MCHSHYLKNSGSQGKSLASGYFLVLWRTLNSDIVTQSNNLSNQLSTHDASIKSLLNTFKFVKSIQRGTDRNIELVGGKTYSINISDVDPNKSIVLFGAYGDNGKYINYQLLKNSILVSNTDRQYTQTIYALTYQVVEFY